MSRSLSEHVDVMFSRATWDDIVMSANRMGISSSQWLASAVKFGLEMDQPYIRMANGDIVEREVRQPLVFILND